MLNIKSNALRLAHQRSGALGLMVHQKWRTQSLSSPDWSTAKLNIRSAAPVDQERKL